MKSIVTFATALILLCCLQFGMSSCKKEKIVEKTVTDTLYVQDPILTTADLTSHPWKVYEQRGVLGNTVVYYLRGGSTNTVNFDNFSLKFNADGTGTHSNNGSSLNLTWTFANAEHTKLTYTLMNTPATFNVNWENIRFKDGKINVDEYFKDGNSNQNAHSHVVLMP